MKGRRAGHFKFMGVTGFDSVKLGILQQVETYDLLKSYKTIDADNVIYADFGKRTALAA